MKPEFPAHNTLTNDVYMVKQDYLMRMGRPYNQRSFIGKTTTMEKIADVGGEKLAKVFSTFWKYGTMLTKERQALNIAALKESLANQMAVIRGFPSQEIDLVEGTLASGDYELAINRQMVKIE